MPLIMKTDFKISDNKGRILLQVRGDRILVARFPKMSNSVKQAITEFFVTLTDNDSSSIMDFLNFKRDSSEFCS